jgi:hypothetical protein
MLSDKQAAERRLQAFITRRLAEERDTVAPELHEYIVGNSEAEVEAAITLAKTKTQAILAGIRSARARPDDVDPAWVQANREGVGDQVDIGSMDMTAYANYRAAAGIGQSKNAVGIFGPIGH